MSDLTEPARLRESFLAKRDEAILSRDTLSAQDGDPVLIEYLTRQVERYDDLVLSAEMEMGRLTEGMRVRVRESDRVTVFRVVAVAEDGTVTLGPGEEAGQ